MSELYHYGVIGQKWGVRNYQNPDGSLTAAGRKRYSTGDTKIDKKTASARDQYLKNINDYNKAKAEGLKKGTIKKMRIEGFEGESLILDRKTSDAYSRASEAFTLYTKYMDKKMNSVIKEYKRGKTSYNEAKNLVANYLNMYGDVGRDMLNIENENDIKIDMDAIDKSLKKRK